MKNKKIFIIIIAVIALFGIGFLVINNQQDNKKEKNLNWEEIFTEILNDKNTFKDTDEGYINLNDLDNNGTPELIIKYFNIDKYIAKIYQIKENQSKTETKEISLDKDFSFEYLYDFNEEKYGWYVITNDDNIYDLKIDSENIITENTSDYKNDFINITEKKEQTKINFNNINSSDIINSIKKEYIPNKNLVTDKITEEVENKKIIRSIKKIDDTKDLVYTARSGKGDSYSYYYEYPAINIDSEEIKSINSEIAKNFEFYENDFIFTGEIAVTTYNYYINGRILSLVIMRGGNSSTWSITYNIDLSTGKNLTLNELIKDKNIDLEIAKNKLKEASSAAIETSTNNMKKELGQYWNSDYSNEVTKIQNNAIKNAESLNYFYLNSNGELTVRSEYEIFGGQWTCTKTIEYTYSDNPSVKEIKYTDYKERGPNSQNK